VALYIGLFLAMLTRHWQWPQEAVLLLIGPMSLLFVLAIIIMFITGLYDLELSKNNKTFFQKIIMTALVWMLLGVIYFYINPSNKVSPKTILLLTSVCGFGLVTVWRYIYNRFVSTTLLQTNIIFVGYNTQVRELINILISEPQRGMSVKGIVNFGENMPAFADIINAKKLNDIIEQIDKSGSVLIVLSEQMQTDQEILRDLYACLFKEIGIIRLDDFYEQILSRIPPFTFSETYFVANLKEQNKKIYDRFKMLADLLCGAILAVFFALSFPFIALAIKLNSAGPIFFQQKRIGKLGRPFNLYKYRTMKALSADGSAEISGPQFATAKDKRITNVGKFLRQTRLDEIPQFINLFKREMSIIGPRPERPEFVAELTQAMPYYKLRHLIKPGITGWAQIKHGYTGQTDEHLRKLEYDLFYIKNRGPLLDTSIILKTANIIARLAGK